MDAEYEGPHTRLLMVIGQGQGRPWPSPGAERLVTCWGDKAPKMGVWEWSPRSQTVSAISQSVSPVSFVHVYLHFMIYIHGRWIYPKIWMTPRSIILAAEGHKQPAGYLLSTHVVMHINKVIEEWYVLCDFYITQHILCLYTVVQNLMPTLLIIM